MEYYDEIIEVKRKQSMSSEKTGNKSSAGTKKDPPAPVAVQSLDDSDRTTTKRPASSLPRKSAAQLPARIQSDTESSESESEANPDNPADAFNYKQWETLNISSEIKDLYQYIAKFVFLTKQWVTFKRTDDQILRFLDIHQLKSIYRIAFNRLYRTSFQLLAI